MITAWIAATVLISPQTAPAQPVATRFDMGERLKMMDVAWLNNTSPERKRAGAEIISRAVVSFFGNQYSRASQQLDAATAALRGSPVSASDAVTLRFEPAWVEPGKPATLVASWAYLPENAKPVSLLVGGKRATIEPGKTPRLEVMPSRGAPDSQEGAVSNEVAILMQANLDNHPRQVQISVVRNAKQRVENLLKSENPIVQTMAQQMKQAMEAPERQEQEMPLMINLATAESLNEGRTKLWNLADLPLAKHGQTFFRAAFPRSVAVEPEKAPPVNVVIAFHGAGGSENLFFEGYGRGLAAQEALKRGWVFIAPRMSQTGAKDVMDWLTNERKLKVNKLFVMGHSAGGALAMMAMSLDRKPDAAALFAPASGRFNKEWTELPLFYAVGKQEFPQILRSARALSKELDQRRDFKYVEYDPCEHLMIVAEAARDAYAFLDVVAAK